MRCMMDPESIWAPSPVALHNRRWRTGGSLRPARRSGPFHDLPRKELKLGLGKGGYCQLLQLLVHPFQRVPPIPFVWKKSNSIRWLRRAHIEYPGIKPHNWNASKVLSEKIPRFLNRASRWGTNRFNRHKHELVMVSIRQLSTIRSLFKTVW